MIYVLVNLVEIQQWKSYENISLEKIVSEYIFTKKIKRKIYKNVPYNLYIVSLHWIKDKQCVSFWKTGKKI